MRLAIYLYIYFCIYLHIFLYLSTIYIYFSIYLHIFLYLSTYISLSIYSLFYLSIYTYICLSIYPTLLKALHTTQISTLLRPKRERKKWKDSTVQKKTDFDLKIKLLSYFTWYNRNKSIEYQLLRYFVKNSEVLSCLPSLSYNSIIIPFSCKPIVIGIQSFSQ